MTNIVFNREHAPVNRIDTGGFAAIGLYMPKNKENVGGVLRAAGCYGAAMVAIAGQRFHKYPTDTNKEWRRTPVLQVNDLLSVTPYDCVPVAIELVEGAKSLVDYVHPERAYYIFGPEDGSIPNEIVKACRDKIYIPTRGCMNLMATVNVVLYDRLMKQQRKG